MPDHPKKKTGRKPVNLWPRRIITGLGLVLIVSLIVWGIFALIRSIFTSATAQSDAQSKQPSQQSGAVDPSGHSLKDGQQATADGLLSTDSPIHIPTCLDRNLAVTAAGATTVAGTRMPVTLTLTNTSAVACQTSLERYGLTISTGEQNVYDSRRCGEDSRPSTTLLLRPSGTWSGQLDWDGNVYTNGCQPPATGARAAAPGTYRVAITAQDTVLTSTIVEVTAPPAPQSGTQSGTQSAG